MMLLISVKRFLSLIKDSKLREKCLEAIGAHEFGHNLSLVKRKFNIGKVGLKEGHCNGEKGPCVMEQVNVPGAKTIEEQAKLLVSKKIGYAQIVKKK